MGTQRSAVLIVPRRVKMTPDQNLRNPDYCFSLLCPTERGHPRRQGDCAMREIPGDGGCYGRIGDWRPRASQRRGSQIIYLVPQHCGHISSSAYFAQDFIAPPDQMASLEVSPLDVSLPPPESEVRPPCHRILRLFFFVLALVASRKLLLVSKRLRGDEKGR